MSDLEAIQQSVDRLDNWITKNEWRAYDPFDGLNAKYLKFFTFNNHYLRIVLQQSVRRFPINLRPLLGIKKEVSSKGMGFCALGYLDLYKTNNNNKYKEKAKFCLDWLQENYCKGYSGYAWGNHFDYESRGGRISSYVPSIVWTSWIGLAFIKAYEIMEEPNYFDVAKSICDFIVNDIPRTTHSNETVCIDYTPQGNHNLVHNSNVLGAWLLSRLFRYTKDKEILTLAKKSIAFTVAYQLSNGGWYYGVGKKYHWIDSFHTGYVLESIYGYQKASGDKTFENKLTKGYQFFKSTFFGDDGSPRYYDYKTYPIDIQCASQGIQTLVNLSEYDKGSIDLAMKVAIWTIKKMQHRNGYFYYRKYPICTNKTATFHWGQATMLAALSKLLSIY